MLPLPTLRRFFPFLNWPKPDAALLRGEALAGLSVGLMVLPQGVAYAALAGMPLVTGIYASMLPALVAVLFGASQRLSVGPTALSALLVSASLTGMAEPGSAQWATLAVWLALLSGLLQVVLGWARFGWLLNLVNGPVLMAFTQAAAVLIVASQWRQWLGWAPHTVSQGWGTLNWGTLAFGLGSALLLLLARRWRPGFPAVLGVVGLASALSIGLDYGNHGGAVVGALPGGLAALPGLLWPDWPGWDALGRLVVPSLVITLVSFVETASSARVDSAGRGEPWRQNQDLIGQGLAKMVAGLNGAFPTSSSFSRSALNIYAGARSGWATLFSVGVVLLALLLFLPVLGPVPQAVLSAIIVVTVIGLIQPLHFRRLWRISRIEFVIAVATFAITLLSAPQLYWGVLAGVMMSLAHFLFQHLHPRIIEVGVHADGRLRDRHLWKLPPLAPNTLALRLDAGLDFSSASALETAISDYLLAHPNTRRVMLFAQSVNRIDATGVECFARLRQQLAQQQRTLVLVGVKLPVERVLQAAGELEPAAGLELIANEDAFKHQAPDQQPG